MGTQPSARVLAHSISASSGIAVATLEVTMHRFVLAEFNTHRVFSRNSASSRAIPFRRMRERVLRDPAVPLIWAAEQPGMQGGDEISRHLRDQARTAWINSMIVAANEAQRLHDLGVHKSICNRLIEPFAWHTVIVTSAEWDNFFKQRCSPLAQPEIRAAAVAMHDALADSVPTELAPGEWHTPLMHKDDPPTLQLVEKLMISAARCARVSYLTHDGVRVLLEDFRLFKRLVTARPGHWSPLEHVCTPEAQALNGIGNLPTWTQLRHVVEFNYTTSGVQGLISEIDRLLPEIELETAR